MKWRDSVTNGRIKFVTAFSRNKVRTKPNNSNPNVLNEIAVTNYFMNEDISDAAKLNSNIMQERNFRMSARERCKKLRSSMNFRKRRKLMHVGNIDNDEGNDEGGFTNSAYVCDEGATHLTRPNRDFNRSKHRQTVSDTECSRTPAFIEQTRISNKENNGNNNDSALVERVRGEQNDVRSDSSSRISNIETISAEPKELFSDCESESCSISTREDISFDLSDFVTGEEECMENSIEDDSVSIRFGGNFVTPSNDTSVEDQTAFISDDGDAPPKRMVLVEFCQVSKLLRITSFIVFVSSPRYIYIRLILQYVHLWR